MTTYLSSDTNSQEVLKHLMASEVIEIDGHTLIADEDGVWVTNPYGLDCALLPPETEAIAGFLSDMKLGLCYGPTPAGMC